MERLMRDVTRRSDDGESRKRPYARPELKVHGDVEEITQVLRLARVHGQVATADTFFAQ